MEIQKPRSLVCDISFKCSSMLSMGNHYVFCGYYMMDSYDGPRIIYDSILCGSFGNRSLFN